MICPACDHEQGEAGCFLGRLGFLAHYRCRYCGMVFSGGALFSGTHDEGGEA